MSHSDYRGPMKSDLWWSTPDSWQVRYERHLARRDMIARRCRECELARDQSYRLWKQTAYDSKAGARNRRQFELLTQKLNGLTHLHAEECREIKAIEDGYHEP